MRTGAPSLTSVGSPEPLSAQEVTISTSRRAEQDGPGELIRSGEGGIDGIDEDAWPPQD
jgi:hypothetical protein